MEAVKRRLRITATTFHTTSTGLMPQYSPPSLGIRTNAYHMDSSDIFPSWNSACFTTSIFSNKTSMLLTSPFYPSPLSLPPPLPPTLLPYLPPSPYFYATNFTPDILASLNHPWRCAPLIPEGPPYRLDLSLHTDHSI